MTIVGENFIVFYLKNCIKHKIFPKQEITECQFSFQVLIAEKPATTIKIIYNILAVQFEFAWKILLGIDSRDVQKLNCKK